MKGERVIFPVDPSEAKTERRSKASTVSTDIDYTTIRTWRRPEDSGRSDDSVAQDMGTT